MRTRLIAALVATATPHVAMAETPLLAPSGPWNVFSTEDRCVLARDYGSGPDLVTMAFRPLPLSDMAEMRLVTGTKKTGYVVGKGAITLRPGTIKVEGETQGASPGPKLRRTTTMYMSQDAMRALPQASEIEMSAAGERTVRVKPTRIAAALVALKRCNDALTETWGVDLEAQSRVATAAVLKPGPIILSQDYPAKALLLSAEANTTALWRVDAEGKVGDCKVISGNNPLFDDVVCRAIIKRAKYISPAMDAAGKPMVSFVSRNVLWRLPVDTVMAQDVGLLPGQSGGFPTYTPNGYGPTGW